MAPGIFTENNLFVESEDKHRGIAIDALEEKTGQPITVTLALCARGLHVATFNGGSK